MTPPLALCLVVKNRGWIGDFGGNLDSLFRLADPVLARNCVARAVDRRGAQQLLASPLLQETLRALARGGHSFRLADDSVTLRREGRQTHPSVLAERLDAAVDLAQRLTGARRDTEGVDLERALGVAFHAAADALGLAHDDNRVVIRGRLRGVHVEVEAGHHEHRECTGCRVSFGRPFGIGLHVRRRSEYLSELMSAPLHRGVLRAVGGEALRALLGRGRRAPVAAFDDTFQVDGEPREAARALLTPEVRQHLLQLATLATAVTVRDDHLGIRVDRWITEPDELVAAAHVVAMAGAAILGEARLNVVGPFRSRPG